MAVTLTRKNVTRKYTTKKKGQQTKEYRYLYNKAGQQRKSSKLGYQKEATLTKLQFKSGKLTKAGQKYLEQLKNEPNAAKSRYLVEEFELYRKSSINKGDFLTLERFESHLITDKLERMIYNFGTSPEEIAEQLNATLTAQESEKSIYNATDVLALDWNFDTNTITDGDRQWSIEFDYESYNGYKITRIS